MKFLNELTFFKNITKALEETLKVIQGSKNNNLTSRYSNPRPCALTAHAKHLAYMRTSLR